jgi:hypothetical protein
MFSPVGDEIKNTRFAFNRGDRCPDAPQCPSVIAASPAARDGGPGHASPE